MLLNEQRLKQVMNDNRLDAIVATSPENVTYLSGYWALSQWIRRGPQTYVVWPAPGKGEPVIIASASLLDLIADQPVNVASVETFGKFFVGKDPQANLSPTDQLQFELYGQGAHASAKDALAAVLKRLGSKIKRIAVDESGLPPSLDGFSLKNAGPFEVVPGFELFRKIRASKTPTEIDRLAFVANTAEASIAAALKVAKPGISEREMALEFNLETVRQGALPVLYCIGFGTRSAMPNVQPSDARLVEGDLIRFDVGGRYQHYRADIARNAVLGEPSKRVKTYHNALYCGVQRGLEAIRPGVKAADVFTRVVETVRNEGIPHYERSHVGHGIGIDGYDLPILAPDSSDILEEGMVLCVETPFYELGFGGLQVEDMIVIESDGIKTLMKSSGKLKTI